MFDNGISEKPHWSILPAHVPCPPTPFFFFFFEDPLGLASTGFLFSSRSHSSFLIPFFIFSTVADPPRPCLLRRMRSIVCEQTLLFALLVASTSIGSFVLAGTAHSNHHRQHHNNRQSTFKHHQQPYRSAQEIKGCRRYQHRGAGEDPCTKLLREEHRVGALPWENGHEPIPESFAGHLPIRSWQQDEYHGETSM